VRSIISSTLFQRQYQPGVFGQGDEVRWRYQAALGMLCQRFNEQVDKVLAQAMTKRHC